MPITPTDLCVPTIADRPFSREGWIFELKYDGFRMLATKHGDDVALLSRRGTNFTTVFPEIAAELASLPDMVLDAELLMLDADGKARFGALVNRSRLRRRLSIVEAARTKPAALFVFDLLELRGRDLRELALVDRKELLQQALWESGRRIRPIDYVLTFGTELFKMANDAGLEGIVAKRADSPYRRGRSHDWIKIKTAHGRAIDDERASWNER
jgi:bifunctional non-homologous end joining protein LigD